jgi:hypothetical protein
MIKVTVLGDNSVTIVSENKRKNKQVCLVLLSFFRNFATKVA